ncbi:50S ribosomal protein L24 [Candidatus Nanohalobium constans]|uniref:50S ribosomal protein L24 n=1 Tax=Candidatus Nanohalobium constans TaxID=2565781 RepID=A0A5Q0UH34_9ARCH|nr:50S ribosomal protein L24 [Candidatus Nanohalobium constans]QGA80973.1 50S ribosomal protein L24 [Candidatus Nanohalobium constans]
MVDQTQNWSKSWKSSTDPQKQRKYRTNAPQHVKDNLVSANLSHELRDQLDTRSLQLNLGDRVEVARGDFSGSSGIISNIDRENQKVYINGLEVERQDGSTSQVPFKPSNLQIQALNLENIERIEKYDVEDSEEIQVDEEEVEEVLSQEEENEMMQQMQGGGQQPDMSDMDIDEEDMEEIKEKAKEAQQEDKSSQEGSSESEPSEESSETGHDELVDGTMDEVKDSISEMENPDFDALIEAEKAGKDRKTMIEYLENQKEE